MSVNESNKKIGDRIRKLRKEAGLTQLELEEKSGIKANTIARLERGLHRISSTNVEKLAEVFGVSSSEILNR